MTRACRLTPPAALLLASGIASLIPASGAGAEQPTGAAVDVLARATDDLPAIRERRHLRALVNFNRSEYFLIKGEARGFQYELMEQYEKFLNEGTQRKELRIDVIYVPVTFDELLPALRDGRGDIAASGLTITPQRQELVAFTTPYFPDVNEVVVTHDTVRGIERIEDLSGRATYVLRRSSYVSHLATLNEQLVDNGRKPVIVIESDQYIGSEDILEFVNAGVFDFTVVDHYIADLWADVLPNITVNRDLMINEGGKIAWAVRKDNPKLRASLNEFLKQHRKGTLLGNMLFKRYYESTRWITNPLTKKDQKNLEKYQRLFEKYAEQYDFDPLLIAALAYQESKLNPSRNSDRGAVGLMQIRPTTAADKHIAIDDVAKLENNVHAGVKYLAFLRDRYFSKPEIAPADRVYFSLAAYNAGPRRVREMRKGAAGSGLDPNRWFDNVERSALQHVGQETVRYVANIYKYFIAYRQLAKIQVKKAEEREPFINQGSPHKTG